MTGGSWTDQAAAYVLGTLGPDERALFEQQLAVDPELQRGVAEYEETLAQLSTRMPATPPPDRLRARILADAAGVTPMGAAAAKARADSKGPTETKRRPGKSNPLLTALPWALAAAALAAAVSTSLANRAADQREADLVAALGDARGQLAARDSLLATFLGPDVRTASLAATGEAPSMHLFLNSGTEQLVIAAFNLPPAPAGRTYQLWGIETGQNPVSLGVFQTEVDGRAIVSRSVAGGADFDISAVTDEPQGGSAQPTTTPFMVGSWSAVQ